MWIDTHVHVVSHHGGTYPLDPPEITVPPGVDLHGSQVPWFEDRAVNGEELLREMDEAGVDRAVLVQPYSAYRYDNRYVVDCARDHPDRFLAAVIVDVNDDPVRAVDYWVGDKGAAAVRLFLQQDNADWLLAPASRPLWNALAANDTVVLLALFGHQLGIAHDVLARHGGMRFVLDHCGFPDLSGGPGYPRAAELLALSDLANLHLKLSTQVFKSAERAGRPPAEITELLVGTFGAERVMWGSDYPASSDGSYRPSVELGRHACAGLAAEDRGLVLGGTAERLWWGHRSPSHSV